MIGRLQPALFGGLFIGVLSSLPFIKFGNACCCLWVVLGGMLAAWLIQQNQLLPIRASDGLLAGLLAGVIGAFVAFPIEYFVAPMEMQVLGPFILNNPDLPPEMREMLDQWRNETPSVARRFLSLLFSLVLYPLFAMLGGVLGAAIFKKTPPPPPPGPPEVSAGPPEVSPIV